MIDTEGEVPKEQHYCNKQPDYASPEGTSGLNNNAEVSNSFGAGLHNNDYYNHDVPSGLK